MRLSACTRLLKSLCDPFTNEPELYKEMGFNGMDFDLNYKVSDKIGENWREIAEKFAQKSRDLDVLTVQTHLPYGYLKNVGPQGAEESMMNEALEATKILGAPYAVFHAVSTPDPKDGLAATYEYFMPVIEKGKKMGFDLLIEIMPDYVVYPNTAELLIEAADKMGIGICWDFGHYNINKPRGTNAQREKLLLMRDRIKAIHANDNFGTATDEHLPPFFMYSSRSRIKLASTREAVSCTCCAACAASMPLSASSAARSTRRPCPVERFRLSITYTFSRSCAARQAF